MAATNITTPAKAKSGKSRVPGAYSFSANTCLALIDKLTEEQVMNEYSYLRSFTPDTVSPKAPNDAARRNAIQTALTRAVGQQFQKSIANLNALAESIEATLEHTKRTMEKILHKTEDIVDANASPLHPEDSEVVANIPQMDCVKIFVWIFLLMKL